MNERNLKRKVLYALIPGLVICAGAFVVAVTFQFSAFLHQSGLCGNLFVDVLLACNDYPDIKLMILSAGLGALLLLGIVYLFSKRAAAIILATLYSAILFIAFVFNRPAGYAGGGESNLVPFATILVYLSGEPSWSIAWNNLFGNVWPFALLGTLLPFTTKQPLGGAAVAGVALVTGALIETTQAVLQLGIFDIDDILLNALGVAIGYFITSAAIRYRRNSLR